MLSQEGGWWSDVDTLCLSSLIDEPEYAWAQEKPERDYAAIGTSQIAMSSGSQVVEYLYDECLMLSKTAFGKREALGPHLLSRVIEVLGLPKNCYGDADSFYPVRWIEMFKLWLPEYADEVAEKTEKAFFMPVYQSFPKYLGLDIFKLPPRGSYLYTILEKTEGIVSDSNLSIHNADYVRSKVNDFFKRNKDWAPQELEAVAGSACIERVLETYSKD